MKKILLIIMDGLGDRPNQSLNGSTGLQAAYRPNLNYLASHGINGLMFPIREGIRPGSDTSHLSILGYNPEEVYTGRGPFEAMGLGMKVRAGDIAFRANFAYRDKNGVIQDRRAGRISESTLELCEAVSMELDGVKFSVMPGVEHRAALVMSGDNLSDRISDSDPHQTGKPPQKITPLDPDADHTAEVLNHYLSEVRKILDTHQFNTHRAARGDLPANEILLRGAGKAPSLEKFEEKYSMKAGCVVGIPMIAGICDLAGMDVIKYPGATGTVNTDYAGKIRTALQALETRDFVLVNIKAPDVAGHDGNPDLKRKVIEWSDRAFAQIIPKLDEILVAVTGDHSTPCALKEHSGDPVPLVIATAGMRTDGVTRYDEVTASRGSLKIRSSDLMNVLLGLSDRAEKYGA
ncbi:MAG: 2,3-bisphosphoglycerate-independent phosphoglycerate mutase [Thermoplasmataceae archaeon]|jgi:2,3-bisphosphoglycerate-independent phosphoglycerate mutase